MLPVGFRILGGKNGKMYGMKSSIVPINAEKIKKDEYLCMV